MKNRSDHVNVTRTRAPIWLLIALAAATLLFGFLAGFAGAGMRSLY